MMPPNIQEQVVERVGAMETTPMDQIEVVANTLGSRIGKRVNPLESRLVGSSRPLIF